MNATVFELNDTGIYCSQQQGKSLTSPGYALLTSTGVDTGIKAQQHFWLQPQSSFNQFWRQLGLSPLPSTNNYARHHADLAYAQLLQLHRDCGEPDEVIFAAPGSFSNEQLGILLGLAKASPFNVVGLVDSAIAAASQAQLTGPSLHLDIQLHQAILTQIEVNNGIQRTHVEALPELGLKHFHDKWAQHIANLFIQQYRYDPLHTAAGEQQLNNHLPIWLTALNGLDSTTIEMETPQGTYRLNLVRNELLQSSAQLFSRLVEAIAKQSTNTGSNNPQLLLSQRCAQLPGFVQHWSNAVSLNQNAAAEGCFNHIEAICSIGESLNFVTSLPLITSTGALPTSSTENTTQPTHLIYQHRAYSLNSPLPEELNQLGLVFKQIDGRQTLAECGANTRLTGDAKNLQIGDKLTLDNGETISLVEVC